MKKLFDLFDFGDSNQPFQGKVSTITADELHNLRFGNGDGIVMGKHPFTEMLMTYDGYAANTILIGPSRSGKSASTTIPTGFSWKDNAFFLDLKGELWQYTSGFRKEKLHQNIIKFAPYCTDGTSVRWNPLSEIRFGTEHQNNDIKVMASFMLQPELQHEANFNIREALIQKLSDIILNNFKRCDEKGLPYPTPEFLVNDLELLKHDETSSLTQRIQSALSIYANPTIAQNTSDLSLVDGNIKNKPDFSIHDFINGEGKQKTSIYFVCSIQESKEVWPLANLMVQLILYRRFEKAPIEDLVPQNHLLMVLDDFLKLQMEHFEDMLSQTARHSTSLLLTCDDIDELAHIYPQYEDILSKCAVKVYYAPESKPGHTAEQIAISLNTFRRSLKNIVMEQEIYDMGFYKELIFLHDYPPIYTDRIPFYLIPTFLNNAKIKPAEKQWYKE